MSFFAMLWYRLVMSNPDLVYCLVLIIGHTLLMPSKFMQRYVWGFKL